MGIFDKLFKVNEDRVKSIKMSKEEAFMGIIMSSMLIDEVVTHDEMQVVVSNLAKLQSFKTIHPNQLMAMLDKYMQIIRKEGPGTIIEVAKSFLDPNMKDTAFAIAVDVILSDGLVEYKEKEFLEKLQRALEIPDDIAKKIAEVMIIKNRGTSFDFSPIDPEKGILGE